jgi:hypothetical protein
MVTEQHKVEAQAFIAQLGVIPPERWCVARFCLDEGQDNQRCCVLGHLGVRVDNLHTPAAEGLKNLIQTYFGKGIEIAVVRINDGHHPNFPHATYRTPKERVLAALRLIVEGKA